MLNLTYIGTSFLLWGMTFTSLVIANEEEVCRGIQRRLSSTRKERILSEVLANDGARAGGMGCDSKKLLNVADIPKYVTDFIIPPVLHDDNGQESYVEISMREIEQQVLPDGFPTTRQWAYGSPKDSRSFMNPSGTIEVTQNKRTQVTWVNELVEDPDTCRCDPTDENACKYLPHVLQDACGTPIVDQTLHWANPQCECLSGEIKTDCRGINGDPYLGPVPIIVHIHGAHTTSESDGYPEAWFMPHATNIPDGYATTGSFYNSNEPDLRTDMGACSGLGENYDGDIPGRTTSNYPNDQPTTALWYHDHTLGITRLNCYAAGAGFWNIRTSTDGESGLSEGQTLPGPPAKIGEDPNTESARAKIREIPIVIQPKTFYDDGSLWYPANRQFFDGQGEGIFYGSNCKLGIPTLPVLVSDVSPVWNPEAFFNTMVVNGRTWPKLEVASERYRFRIVNAADSTFLNLALFVGTGSKQRELPFYVIGSDQGLLPYVTKITTGSTERLNGPQSTFLPPPPQTLLMAPAERYDVIIDFSDFDDEESVFLVNTGPDEPFGGWEENDSGEFDPAPADPDSTGQIMKFIINTSLNNPDGDPSTPVDKLILDASAPGGNSIAGSPVKMRQVGLHEEESSTIIRDSEVKTFDGPVAALLGTPEPRRWMDPIGVTVSQGAVEIWEIDNNTADAHPIHIHQVRFQVVYRWVKEGDSSFLAPAPQEEGWKDTVIAYPGQITAIKAEFEIKGLFVWHCHILSHEDNEMMLPYCVGECGVDCPASLCPI